MPDPIRIPVDLATAILAELSHRLPSENAAHSMIALQTALGHPQKEGIMAFSLNLAAVEQDIADVEKVLAIVEKYDGLLPIPASIKTAVADLDLLLKFAVSALSDV